MKLPCFQHSRDIIGNHHLSNSSIPLLASSGFTSLLASTLCFLLWRRVRNETENNKNLTTLEPWHFPSTVLDTSLRTVSNQHEGPGLAVHAMQGAAVSPRLVPGCASPGQNSRAGSYLSTRSHHLVKQTKPQRQNIPLKPAFPPGISYAYLFTSK